MYAALTDRLRSWRLETRQEVNGDRTHYIFASGAECWRPLSRIGGGTFGEVWQEQCLSGPHINELRAVKHISKRQAQFTKSSQRELEALVTFSDARYQEHFVRCLGWFEDENNLFIAMEFVQNGDLQGYIKQGDFRETEVALITAQVAWALQYMHQLNFVHRDLKPQNILVSQPGPQWRVKVADFGIARVMDGTNFGTRNIGTYGYMAPELRDQSTRCTPAVDVWALGAVAFCMRTGRPPTDRQLIDYQRDQEHSPGQALGTCSGSLMAFVMAMMADRPELRLTMEQVLAHEWLVTRTSGTTSQSTGPGPTTTSTGSFDIKPANTWSNTFSGDSSSTVRPLQPTAIPIRSPVPGTMAQKTGSIRPQSIPGASMQSSRPKPQFPPPSASPAQAQTSIVPPVTVHNSQPKPQFPSPAASLAQSQTSMVPPAMLPNSQLDTQFLPSAASLAQAQTSMVPPTTLPINPRSPRPLTPAQPELRDAAPALSRTNWRKGSDPLGSRDRTNTSANLVPVSLPDVRRASAPSMTATAYPSQIWNPYEQPPVNPPPSTTMKPRTIPPTTGRNETTSRTAGPRTAPHTTGRNDTAARTAGDPYLTCGTCGKIFKERAYLMGHVRASGHEARTSEKPQKSGAPSCPSPSGPGRSAVTPEVMATQPTHPTQPGKDPYLTCATCNKTFKHRAQLMDHVATSRHKPRQPVDPRLTCLACHKPFQTRSDLFEHLEATGHARDLATGKPEPPKVFETAGPVGFGGPNEGLEGYYATPQRVPREDFRRGREKINPGVNPNEILEGYYTAPQHLPREDFRQGGGKIDSDLTCLTCHKRFRERGSLFNHLALSGHARDLATGRPERYRGQKGSNTAEYLDFDSTDSDIEEEDY